MRAFTLLAMCLGCASPTVPSYLPTLAVAAGVAATVEEAAPVPEPAGKCQTCDGRGWLGDGQPRADCPDCESEWDDKFGASDEIQKLIGLMETMARSQKEMAAHLADLMERVERLESSSGRSGTVSPQRDAAPASSNHSGDAAGANRGAPAVITWMSVPAAKADPRPVWFHFTQSQGCVHCVRMDRTSLVDPRVVAASKKYAPCKIVDWNPAVSPRFHVGGGFPSDVIVGQSGAILRSSRGYRSPDGLLKFLEGR